MVFQRSLIFFVVYLLISFKLTQSAYWHDLFAQRTILELPSIEIILSAAQCQNVNS